MSLEVLPPFDATTRLLATTSPDGRYRDEIAPLAEHVSEFGRFKRVVHVEAANLVFLSRVGPEFGVSRTINQSERDFLLGMGPNLTLRQALRIKDIEEMTRHDVDALVRMFKEL